VSQLVRLGAIALQEIWLFGQEEVFANFLTKGLDDGVLPESEARELVLEWVRNPAFLRRVTEPVYYAEEDAYFDYRLHREFETIWKLTLTTPREVHMPILAYYPLYAGDVFESPLPDNVLEGLDSEGLEILVWRGYDLLLERMREAPSQFDGKVHEAARRATELEARVTRQHEHDERSELELLRKQFANSRVEIEKMRKTIADLKRDR
jgi:hypothetical protein